MKKGTGLVTALDLEEKMIKKFGKRRSFDNQTGRGKKRIDSTSVVEVSTEVQEKSNGGVQLRIAR